MDFWSRLVGGSRSPAVKVLRNTSPTERLTAFKRTCNTLQQIWRSSNIPAGDLVIAGHTRTCIERLNSVLNDESRGPAPHPCLAYASSSQIYITVTKLVLTTAHSHNYIHDDDDDDDGNDNEKDNVLRAAAVFFNTLIDAELDGIVDNRLFARALVDLVRRADTRAEDVETRLIELLFGVANNIRLQPSILPAWFAPRQADVLDSAAAVANGGKEFAGTTRKDDFPLFYLLLDYVHHEGRAGDFARTGLLYLIETASRSKTLERWLIESDLATLMATGLGALYSQLGSLSVESSTRELPSIVALSDDPARPDTAIQPRHLGRAMDSFLSYLLFWQDTIDHCKSDEVNGTLLDHFQILFLQQLLYPSLLESSDVEGGSTAAVLTYLYRILESIDQADLVHRILHFLLASSTTTTTDNNNNNNNNNNSYSYSYSPYSSSDAAAATTTAVRSEKMSMSRRKSLDVLTAFAEEAAKPSPALFNLRDLALMGLRSSNQQTVHATMRLLAVILQRHHSFTRLLIKTIPRGGGSSRQRQRTIGGLNAELQQLLSLAASIVDEPSLDESYEAYLKDAVAALEARLYSLSSAQVQDNNDDGVGVGVDVDCAALELGTTDALFKELLRHLASFFTNSVAVNLALTEVLISIASSHLVSLDGWLLVDPAKYRFSNTDTTGTTGTTDTTGINATDNAETDTTDRNNTDNEHTQRPAVTGLPPQIRRAYLEPTWSSKDMPLVVQVLDSLVRQIQTWQQDVADFRVLVTARRALLRQDWVPGPSRSASRQRSQPPPPPPPPPPPAAAAASSSSSTRTSSRNTRDVGPRHAAGAAEDETDSSPRGRGRLDYSSSSADRAAVRRDRSLRPPATSSSRASSVSRAAAADELRRRLATPFTLPTGDAAASAAAPVAGADTDVDAARQPSATLGHVLTNVVVLYEFVLELSALVQVRSSVFEEVSFEEHLAG